MKGGVLHSSCQLSEGLSFTHYVDAERFGAHNILAYSDAQSIDCGMWLTFVEHLYICLTCMSTLSSVAHAGLDSVAHHQLCNRRSTSKK